MASIDNRSPPVGVLVVDDEELARRNVTLLLRRDPSIGAVTECETGAEAIHQIRILKPDIVFLDVQMPQCDGFDVLERLGCDAPPAVIFVTAYDEYALRAFEVGALDYLLKPFDDARFARALDRAKEKLAHVTRASLRTAERLVIKSHGRVQFVNVAEIDWIEAVGYYACLHIGGETHIIRRTLVELMRDLGSESFVRIHRSIIVNLNRIHAIEVTSGDNYEAVLNSKIRLRLSRRFRVALQKRLGMLAERDTENIGYK